MPRSTGRRVVGGLIRAGGFGVLLWLGGFTWFVATRPGAAPLALTTDAVVVLTGGPGRLARGAQVLAAGAARRMLVSGVDPRVGKPALAASIGAPARMFDRDVDLGIAAVDTRSNAVETTAWIARHRYRSLRLVTSAAHMRRARLELRAQLPAAVRIVPDGVPADVPADSLAREFNKYVLRGAALAAGRGMTAPAARGGPVPILRSLVFALVFYSGSVPIILVAALITVVCPGAVVAVARLWAGWFALCSRALVGVRLVVEGVVPQHAALVAIKHQAAYETIIVLWLFRAPAVVMKAELQRIPFWGFASRAHGTIPVDRAGSGAALRTMLRAAAAAKAADRPVVIFPEGTRTAPGDAAELRAGLAGLYRALKLPLVPVALDSGRCWPRGFVKHSGTIRLSFGEAIPPGLDRREVEARVHLAINALNRPDA